MTSVTEKNDFSQFEGLGKKYLVKYLIFYVGIEDEILEDQPGESKVKDAGARKEQKDNYIYVDMDGEGSSEDDEDAENSVAYDPESKKNPSTLTCYELDPETKGVLNMAIKQNMALTWRYRDAPAVLKTITSQGGDEDHLAFLPNTYAGSEYIFQGKNFFG